jgi:3'-5' exoribonuclease
MADRTKQKEHAYKILLEAGKRISNPELSYSYRQVLQDDEVWMSPASSDKHQSYEWGLLIHTAEVMELALKMADTVLMDIDFDALITAIIWHDYAKIYDYKKKEDGTYEYTDHAGKIGHLPKSYALFSIWAHGYKTVSADFIDKVGHIMLAHHGRKEWGSPREPQTAEAYIIHYADMLSAKVTKDYYEG